MLILFEFQFYELSMCVKQELSLADSTYQLSLSVYLLKKLLLAGGALHFAAYWHRNLYSLISFLSQSIFLLFSFSQLWKAAQQFSSSARSQRESQLPASRLSNLLRSCLLRCLSQATRRSVQERQMVMYSYFCLRISYLVFWKWSERLRFWLMRFELFKLTAKYAGNPAQWKTNPHKNKKQLQQTEGGCGYSKAQSVPPFRVTITVERLYLLELDNSQMDIERNSFGSRRSNQANDRSSLKSVMSLERLSEHRHSSLSKRVSLINAMDIEIPSTSIYSRQDDLLGGEDSNRFSDFRRSSNKSKEPYEYKADIHQRDLNRNSQYKIKHECNCSEQECSEHHCICYLTPREICVIGQCCPRCIASKNDYLQTTRGFTLNREKKAKEFSEEQNTLLSIIKQKNSKNMHYFKQVYANQPCMKDLVFCTCKKSHCQKKYCLCFQKGIKCGEFCICIECENKEDQEDEFKEEEQRRWERYATYKPYDQSEDRDVENIDPDIQQFLEQENEGFHEVMEFEPVNFDSVLYNSYV